MVTIPEYLKSIRWYAREARKYRYMWNDDEVAKKFAERADTVRIAMDIELRCLASERSKAR